MHESMELIRWDDYLKLVAEAYIRAPTYDQAAVPSYQALVKDVERFFRLLQSKVTVEFVDYDPYRNAEELAQDVRENRRLRVLKLYSEHPFFTEEQNWKFRAVHDWFSHLLGHTPFSPKGEISAYNVHAKMFSRAALPALFTEIVGQVAYLHIKGSFPVQKVAILPGFDYFRLGAVEGYSIQNKALVPHTTSFGTREQKENLLRRLMQEEFQSQLQELGPEAKRPHPCRPEHRFNVQARRCVPLASMLNRKH